MEKCAQIVVFQSTGHFPVTKPGQYFGQAPQEKRFLKTWLLQTYNDAHGG